MSCCHVCIDFGEVSGCLSLRKLNVKFFHKTLDFWFCFGRLWKQLVLLHFFSNWWSETMPLLTSLFCLVFTWQICLLTLEMKFTLVWCDVTWWHCPYEHLWCRAVIPSIKQCFVFNWNVLGHICLTDRLVKWRDSPMAAQEGSRRIRSNTRKTLLPFPFLIFTFVMPAFKNFSASLSRINK